MKSKATIFGLAAMLAFLTAAYAGRGDSGHLKIIYWQAASTLNPFLSGGAKDIEAASMVLEPLARYDENGDLTPCLAAQIPTLENGGISEDLTSITWEINPGILWSDGTALRAPDLKFTADYCMHPDGGCQQLHRFADVEQVEVLDELAIKITFTRPKPYPYGPLVGSISPVIQKAQFEGCMGAKAPTCSEQNFAPVGTGPFRVTTFKANDVITLEANPNYREPDKPGFATLTFKGGGDAAAAARSVLETGEFDYAWNLQIDPTILRKMETVGKGKVVSAFGSGLEFLMVNLTNPAPYLGDKRSTLEGGSHPFLSDAAVVQALSLAIDRDLLSEIGYGPAGKAASNVIPAPALYASTANDAYLVQDIPRANAILDSAGWSRATDGIRAKEGVRLSILYQTSTNPVRQDTQALIKQWWAQLGVETELKNIDAAVFFGGDQSSPDTIQKFYADIQMATNLGGTDVETRLRALECARIPRPQNNWLGSNFSRYCNPEYDALAAELALTAPTENRARLVKNMNDLLVRDGAIIPLIHRGRISAHAHALAGVRINPWDSELWNVADWHRN